MVLIDLRAWDKPGKFVDQGWAVLPVFVHDGYVAHGTFRLPIYQGVPVGEVLTDMVATKPAESTRKERPKPVEAASVLVRIADARREGELEAAATTENEVHLPADPKYRVVARAKPLSSLVPKGMEVEATAKRITEDLDALLTATVTPAAPAV